MYMGIFIVESPAFSEHTVAWLTSNDDGGICNGFLVARRGTVGASDKESGGSLAIMLSSARSPSLILAWYNRKYSDISTLV